MPCWGVLDSLLSAGLYDEMPFLSPSCTGLRKATTPRSSSAKCWPLSIYTIRSGSSIAGLSPMRRNFISNMRRPCSANCRSKKLDVQLLLQLNLVVLHLVCDRGGEARKAMTRIQATGLVFYNFPAFRIARLVNLLLQAECGRFDFAENEIKSIRRSTAIGNSSVEKLVFRFVRLFPLPGSRRERGRLWNGCTVRCRQLRPINTSGRYSNTSILRHGSRRA